MNVNVEKIDQHRISQVVHLFNPDGLALASRNVCVASGESVQEGYQVATVGIV